MNILLVCAAGMSTSLVVNKMKKALTEEEKNWTIEAQPVDSLEEVIDDYDVILLGPQIKYKADEINKIGDEYNTPVGVVDSKDYGMGKGRNILNQAIKLKENY
ncbi:PTS system cellobiose-specific IIB component [Halanaerobium saccharolyticum]|uniref:PTS system cellobiose-specific IIB component n=1 Tax=Halanaerobium saccharolyticum TaxID=43595 RepID=A0A4R7Z8W7_9FIRM|nr:PTS sugar transporter subunit IIB [Halanaerobium saccharolyticum]RAK11719.1 PTS system cellobiose-specific IIB component [Halanaerobium saccharolyticum]TDW07560.1 PTS system cellobiose-specific IIB component [Halanaerobium saccharolyticum]TDX64481.1 PTS system cellobiose-specific IIB component [Halanaerobium saccharolyticum]